MSRKVFPKLLQNIKSRLFHPSLISSSSSISRSSTNHLRFLSTALNDLNVEGNNRSFETSGEHLGLDFLHLEKLQRAEVNVTLQHEEKKIYFETYGCQMNFNDLEVVLAIMKDAGYVTRVDVPEASDVILINTCAIRENAESRVWQRLNYFMHIKNKKRTEGNSLFPKVVVLGCMAERLKEKLIEADKMVDVVCGPDAYRDLPRLLTEVDSGQAGINTLLSLEETYADISPIRIAKNAVTAFVSIMRGCDNMCSYCIVPFTRGRERSRPVSSIIREVGELWDQGVKEVTLLGQNVNSYRDESEGWQELELSLTENASKTREFQTLSKGFSTIYKPKAGGFRFSHLLDILSSKFPLMRFRFTSPHPKDFPDELLLLMAQRPNICKHIHLPAQSGSSSVLDRMRRGYSRESYLELVKKIRDIVPGVALSSDFIVGFCGETEEDHKETLALVKEVGYDMAYMFAYSMREKTHAHRKLEDNVPEETKKRRLQEVIAAFRESTKPRYQEQIGQIHLVLVEGESKRAPETNFMGRNDTNHRVIFPKLPVPQQSGSSVKLPKVGDYIAVKITETTYATLKGIPLRFGMIDDGEMLGVDVLARESEDDSREYVNA